MNTFKAGSGATAACLLASALTGTLVPIRTAAGEEAPINASATIELKLTPAGHVGAEVAVTFPGPKFYQVESWGEPRLVGELIVLEARTGSPYFKGGAPPFPPERATHLYKLLDVDRFPGETYAPLPFRSVAMPGGTSPIPQGTVVLRSRQEWNDWIAPYDMTLGPLPVAPPVDFDREIFIGVFLGPTPGCHAVEIRRISSRPNGAMVVDYTVSLPAPGKPVTEALIHPQHVVGLARTTAPVTFTREEALVPYPAKSVALTRPDYPFLAPELPMTTVIRSDAAWARFLDRVAGPRDPAFPAPPVDLTNQMLIAVFLGRTPLGRGISIETVVENGEELLVHVQQTTGGAPPPPDEFTYPFDFVAVPRSDLPVRFERTEIAFPSPPPPSGERREPRDGAANAVSSHGYFDVVFFLNGCELARQEFAYPEVPPPGGLVLDALTEAEGTLALDAVFDLGLTAQTMVAWEKPRRDGANLSANVSVLPRPQTPTHDVSTPGTGTYSHRYVVADLEPGLYRFELRVNGSSAGHVFLRHPSSAAPGSAFEAWLEPLLIRPVWEPVPEAGRLGDIDSDGAGDFFEYALGSDPFDPASLPTWEVQSFQEPGKPAGLELSLTRRDGIDIGLLHSSDLVTWKDVSTAAEFSAEPAAVGFEHVTLRWHPAGEPSPAAYVRLKLTEKDGGAP